MNLINLQSVDCYLGWSLPESIYLTIKSFRFKLVNSTDELFDTSLISELKQMNLINLNKSIDYEINDFKDSQSDFSDKLVGSLSDKEANLINEQHNLENDEDNFSVKNKFKDVWINKIKSEPIDQSAKDYQKDLTYKLNKERNKESDIYVNILCVNCNRSTKIKNLKLNSSLIPYLKENFYRLPFLKSSLHSNSSYNPLLTNQFNKSNHFKNDKNSMNFNPFLNGSTDSHMNLLTNQSNLKSKLTNLKFKVQNRPLQSLIRKKRFKDDQVVNMEHFNKSIDILNSLSKNLSEQLAEASFKNNSERPINASDLNKFLTLKFENLTNSNVPNSSTNSNSSFSNKLNDHKDELNFHYLGKNRRNNTTDRRPLGPRLKHPISPEIPGQSNQQSQQNQVYFQSNIQQTENDSDQDNGNYSDDDQGEVYYHNPEELLEPWHQNPFFFPIIIT